MKPASALPLTAALCLLLGACVAVPPRAPTTDWQAASAPVKASAGAHGNWPASDWWRAFQAPQLDSLIERALADSPNLALAEARFQQARQGIALNQAAAGVMVGASAGANRQRLSDNGLIPPQFLGFNWYSQGDLGAQLQYDFDFWGRHKAAIEAAVDQAHAAAAERDAARLMITSAVADTYFGWQTTQARLALATARIAARQSIRDIAAARVERGIDNASVLDQADAALAGAREQAAELAAGARLQRVGLAALLGIGADQLPPLTVQSLPTLDLALPATVGIDLIARRPDINASRWRVEAALSRRAAARAAFYPDFSLSALLGLSSIDLGKLLNAGSLVANVGPALHLPLFDSGRLKAQYGAVSAELDSAIAAYHASVVDAAREAASQALQLDRIAQRRSARQAQVAAIDALHQRTAARAAHGLSDARPALESKAALIDQNDAMTALHGAALAADIALIKALGGGYQADAAPTPSTSTHKVTAP